MYGLSYDNDFLPKIILLFLLVMIFVVDFQCYHQCLNKKEKQFVPVILPTFLTFIGFPCIFRISFPVYLVK